MVLRDKKERCPSLCFSCPQFYLAAPSLSLQLSLSSLPSLSFPSPASSHKWNHTTGLRLHCGQENEDHTGAMNCSAVPLPLLLLVGHGNLTNKGNDWRDGGGVWRRTGNREQETISSRREKRSEHAETERRLWSSCRNCGMRNWKAAMQLKVRAN